MMLEPKIVGNAISEAGIRLTSFEVSVPSVFLAELFSNRELSITVAGGNVQKPMTDCRVLITATHNEFAAFFTKYNDLSDTPHFLNTLAAKMMAAQLRAPPALVSLGDWYLPYIDFHTIEDVCLIALDDSNKLGLSAAQLDMAATSIATKISVVRCHNVEMLAPPPQARHEVRMQYLNRLLTGYLPLFERSPLSSAYEHQAQPDYLREPPHNTGWANAHYHGNFRGWQQHRRMFVEPPLVTRAHNLSIATQQEYARG